MIRRNIYITICVLTLSSIGQAAEYRVDSQRKFDEVSSIELNPGDSILLKRGQTFRGMLAPTGKGVEGKPIRVTAYGKGKRPVIQAEGRHVAGLLLKEPSFWEVDGLEITNTNGTNKDQGDLFGIYVVADETEGVYRHVYIDDCHVHDVNGMVPGKRRGGIHVHIRKLRESTFDDLRITNNVVENVGGVGIGNDSSCGRVRLLPGRHESRNLWTRVYVAGNHVDTTGRNNVIARVSKDAVYEFNTLANSSRESTGHSIFCFNTDGMKIQYNEAYGNRGEGGIDRGGFDADYNCINTFIQYNYSHDNNWFCGIMKRPTRNVVIRYNISQNDREGIYFYGFDKEKKAENVHIYNNTHFVRAGLDVEVFVNGRTPVNTRFENNIFYFEGAGQWGRNAVGINTVFRNNLYFNIDPHPSDTQPLVGDPRFTQPGQTETGIDLTTMEDLVGYRLQKGSPAIDSGITISNNGGLDLLKTSVVGGWTNVGALE
ncbi:right-handed parallel beta-helix repeat-containing protein [Rhodopirellula sallentina]|uniref:Putative secreted protein n=1 Tax=Rhodopirellula sallentina SM41 TaxID=1263870 RepID=M5U6V5_9BACT|nr:right-handed parallel beta-helix repeat-containing protein [Rhodopirellula sallentina]EMI57165.1 putative secreted protein [Rhodopirellula sallentina SM41]